MSDTSTQAGCGIKPANLPRPKEISVNGVVIARNAIARETQNHPAAKPIEAWLAAARALVVRELLLQEALKLGIQAAPAEDADGRRETDEEALIRTVVEQQVVTPTANEEECRRFYEQNSGRFRSAAIYEVRHILFVADPRDNQARAVARTRAEAAIAALSTSPDQFSALAAELSACPSASAGGNLGQITTGQTVREFEAALARMQPGEISTHPIETRYGYHVVHLDRRIDGAAIPFEVARERIAEWLEEKVSHTAARQYIAALAGAAVITGIALGSSPTPPVQ